MPNKRIYFHNITCTIIHTCPPQVPPNQLALREPDVSIRDSRNTPQDGKSAVIVRCDIGENMDDKNNNKNKIDGGQIGNAIKRE